LGIIFLLANTAFPILAYNWITKAGDQRHKLKKIEPLTEDHDLNKKVSRTFVAIQLAKRYFQSFGIVFFYYIPLL